MRNEWTDDEVFDDPETGKYGIGRKNGLAYEPESSKVQAEFVLRQHRRGVKTFEQIVAIAARYKIDMT